LREDFPGIGYKFLAMNNQLHTSSTLSHPPVSFVIFSSFEEPDTIASVTTLTLSLI